MAAVDEDADWLNPVGYSVGCCVENDEAACIRRPLVAGSRAHKQEISLVDKNAMVLGSNGELLTECDARFLVKAKRENGRIKAILELNDGTMSIKSPYDKLGREIFGDIEIFDGDELRTETHIIRVSSFTLSRE